MASVKNGILPTIYPFCQRFSEGKIQYDKQRQASEASDACLFLSSHPSFFHNPQRKIRDMFKLFFGDVQPSQKHLLSIPKKDGRAELTEIDLASKARHCLLNKLLVHIRINVQCSFDIFVAHQILDDFNGKSAVRFTTFLNQTSAICVS